MAADEKQRLYTMNSQSNIQLSSGTHRFLADHRFQDTTVAPGMLHTAIAIAETISAEGKVPALLRSFRFDRAMIVTEFNSLPFALTLSEVSEPHGYVFNLCEYDAPGAYASGRIQMQGGAKTEPAETIDVICNRAPIKFDRKAVYDHFRLRQNQYGPAFQGILSVQLGQDEAFALLADPDPQRSSQWRIDPCVLDCCVQVLAFTDQDEKRTFALLGFEQLQINSTDLAGARVHSHISKRNSDSLLGDLDVYARDGTIALQFSGVELKYLDTAARQSINVAANFTAEPIADALEFWADKFSMPLHIEFAAYNQIFQELLDPSSLFSTNINGTNVLLVRLEDWLGEHATLSLQRTAEERSTLLGDAERYALLPGIEIGQLNPYETRYLHKEIFVDRAYCRHGISFRDAQCILDVGANIGLFSLFCESESPGVKVLSFEPSPAVFELLFANTRLYAPGAKAFNIGLSDTNREAEFTFYRNSSVFSTFHADEQDDHAAIEAVVENVLQDELGEGVDTKYYAAALTQDRTSSESLICQLRTVSHIIRDEKLDRIDILKIDAEKSELDVLRGIEAEHWQRIRQVVLEVHDSGNGETDEACSVLRDQGFEVKVEQEKLLRNSGLYSVFARRPEFYPEQAQPPGTPERHILNLVEEFIDALRIASGRGGAPLLLSLTPPSPELEQKPHIARAIAHAEMMLTNAIAPMNGVHLLRDADLPARYRLETYFDPHGNIMGNVPYTRQCYSALGTSVFRAILSLTTTPKKVLVLDCDNTLWRGVCGEDGIDGVKFEPGHMALQRLAIACREHGILIGLASKNEEADVLRVFDERPQMALHRDHLATWQINWDSKSNGILKIANELNLGLDSFVFLDDNPLECAEVRAACPEVLTIQVPTVSEELTHFVEHLWALDRRRITAEDRKRAEFYVQEEERKSLRSEAESIVDFINKLDLRVEVFDAKPTEFERVSQLTQRTNQFNFTTIRCSLEEVREYTERANGGWMLVKVQDRFGDYGIVGAARYTIDSTLFVDAFMISCRVLGRGVEHRVISALGEVARDRGCIGLTLTFRRSSRNDPALDFLINTFGDVAEQIFAGIAEGVERQLTIAIDTATNLAFDPAARNATAADAPRPAANAATIPASHSVLAVIPESLSTGPQIYAAIMTAMTKPRPSLASAFVAPQSELEKICCVTWAKAFKLDQVGIDDDFFALGGSSLLAVQIASELSDRLGKRVSTITMFEGSTVRSVAASLAGDSSPERSAQLDASVERGKQRRARVKRRSR